MASTPNKDRPGSLQGSLAEVPLVRLQKYDAATDTWIAYEDPTLVPESIQTNQLLTALLYELESIRTMLEVAINSAPA